VSYYPARVTVDLGAIRENVATLVRRTPAAVMAVVKADAYGHGLVPVARNAVAAGASWLGTAQITEALALRRAGLECRILTWLYAPGAPLDDCVGADIDLSVPALWALDEVRAAARAVGRPARVHLKVDTGMGRNGIGVDEFPQLLNAALAAEHAGEIRVVGVWSHLACADHPEHPANTAQLDAFKNAVRLAEEAGASLEVRHIANSAATLLSPEFHFDLVRPGLATYGLSPAPNAGSATDFELRPALTLSADLVLVKDVPAGQGVSYDLTYTTYSDTTLGVVPLGYGDGIPRHASNNARVRADDREVPLAGRVCMDQFVIDLGPGATARAGDEVVLFGPGAPTAQDWAEAAGTISYEIVTRLGARLPRVYVNDVPNVSE